MGMSKWIRDLQSLAAERRSSGSPWHEHFQEVKAGAAAARDQEHEAAHRASFAERCERFQSFAASLPKGDTADVGLLSSGRRALQILELVRVLEHDARQIAHRLELADPSAHPGILAEYGIQTSTTINTRGLAEKAEAIGQAGSDGLWSSSTDDECRDYALGAARAVERFLNACR